MNIKKYCDNNVIICEDFLLQNEINQIDNFMRYFDYDNLKEHEFKYWGKRLINDYQMKLNPGYENIMDTLNPLLLLLPERIKTILNSEDYFEKWKPSPFNLIKMYRDSDSITFKDNDKFEMFVHIDNQQHMENPILWGAVIYPNNDYLGGEIYYPDYEFEYKPKPGSMVLHTGNTRHGVKRVTSGERFCLASLITIENMVNENPLPTSTDNPKNPYFYPPGYWGKRMPDDPIQGDIKVLRTNGTTAAYNDSPGLRKV